MRKLHNTMAAVFLAFSAAAAQAEGTWTLGAIVEGETGYYIGQKDEATLYPYISYDTDRFAISLHDGLAFHAIKDEGHNGTQTQLSFLLTPRWKPDFGSDPIFNGLKRDTALEAGVRGRYETGVLFFEGQALIDISDTHKGYEATAFAGVQYETGAFSLEAGLGARYRNDDLNRHLFGVSAAEATATRSAYRPGDSTTGFASITAAYALRDNVALVGEISFEDLGRMDRSPLVNKGSNTSVALGLIYQF